MMSVNSPENREVIQRLSDGLESRLAEWFRGDATLDVSSITLEKRPFSFMIRYDVRRVDHKDTALFVRIPRNPQFNTLAKAVNGDAKLQAKTGKYFDSTTRIADAFVGTDFCYIRPLAKLSSFNAVVTEELPSQSLRELFDQSDMIIGRKKPRQQFADHLKQAGCWLQFYHRSIGKSAIQTLSYEDAVLAINHEVDRLTMWSEGAIQTEWLHEQCHHLAKSIAGTPIPFARLHGDFHYANILLAENGRVGGIDANAGEQRHSVYVDIAKLIVDPLTIKRQWLSYGLALSPHRVQFFTEAILQGYFEQQPINMDVLRFYMLLAVINKWAYLEKRLNNLAGNGFSLKITRVLSFFWRRYFQRLSRLVLTFDMGSMETKMS